MSHQASTRTVVLLRLLICCCCFSFLQANSTSPSVQFAEVLEACIRNAAAEAAASHPTWANSCLPPTQKIDLQAAILRRTLASIRDRYGYPGALWCAFYSVRMTGMEYDPNSDQPNNPNIFDWYKTLVCPYDLNQCGDDELGKYGDEWEGVSVAEHATNQNMQYVTHPCKVKKKPPADSTKTWAEACVYVNLEEMRRTMSCGLCGYLKRKLGKPPFTIAPSEPNDPGNEYLYTGNMDFHPFGAWLANDGGFGIDETVRLIHTWRASNGEEMHGYLWQSLRLLAYDTQTLSGRRKELVDDKTALDRMLRVCEPAWYLSPQTRDDCAHAAGHGLFYYYLDIGRALLSCWTDQIIKHAPGHDLNWDNDPHTNGMSATDLTMWRWLCATGVYHAAGNTMSTRIFQHLVNAESTAEEFLCKYSNLFGKSARYFDRCAAGLGIKETERLLAQVKNHECPPEPKELPRWERWQLAQHGQTQQLSCNPAKYFTQAITQCPQSFRAHFPCDPNKLDYDYCTGKIGGMVVKGPAGPRAYIEAKGMWEGKRLNSQRFIIRFDPPLSKAQLDMLPESARNNLMWDNAVIQAWFPTQNQRQRDCQSRMSIVTACQHQRSTPQEKDTCGKMVDCSNVGPHPIMNKQRFDKLVITSFDPFQVDVDVEVTPFHLLCASHTILKQTFECPYKRPPAGSNIARYPGEKESGHLGVWGGMCTCPDGRVYPVADEGNLCGSIACHGGQPSECNHFEGTWAFREVTCARPARVPVSRNVYHTFVEGVGDWGGTCTCPDGNVYLVGDNSDRCASMACIGGESGPCNHYASTWRQRQVICAPGPSPPPKQPPPPPLLPPPPSPWSPSPSTPPPSPETPPYRPPPLPSYPPSLPPPWMDTLLPFEDAPVMTVVGTAFLCIGSGKTRRRYRKSSGLVPTKEDLREDTDDEAEDE